MIFFFLAHVKGGVRHHYKLVPSLCFVQREGRTQRDSHLPVSYLSIRKFDKKGLNLKGGKKEERKRETPKLMRSWVSTEA